ncbi:MAG: ABC transporter substrate-binding protein [Actinomycetota bacterium]
MRCLVALMALLLAVAACGDDGSAGTTAPSTTSLSSTAPTTTATTTTTTRPVRPATTTTTLPETVPVGGSVSLAVVAPSAPFSFSPWAEGFVPSLGEAYLAGAWEVSPVTFDFVPDLVVEMPTTANGGVVVRPDGTMRVTYRIRPDAVWEDGRPVSGEDFAFTYEAITGLGLPDPEAALYAEILPESVAAGEKAFSFTLPRPTIDYERLFGVVLPRHAVAGTDPLTDWSARPWPSAGPFRFLGWAETGAAPGTPGSVAVFERSGAYWHTDDAGRALPYLDTAAFRFVEGALQAVEGFARGGFDAVDLGPWPDVIARLGSLGGVAVTVGDDTAWEHLAFQFGANDRNRASLNESVDFRRAVAHAVDRAALADLPSWVNGGALTSFFDLSPVPSGPGWDRYAYDPPLATALLEDACAAAGRDCAAESPVVVVTTTAEGSLRREVGEMVAGMLDAVGFDARLAVEDAALFFGRTFARGDWDLGLWAWDMPAGASGAGRTLAYWDPAGPPPLGLNYQRWGTPAVSGHGDDLDQAASTVSDAATARYATLLEEMGTTADRDRFLELAAEAEEILADQVVLIPLATRGSALAWWSDTLAGPSHHPSRPGTWNLERWYRPEV